jgi:hypothetical protein
MTCVSGWKHSRHTGPVCVPAVKLARSPYAEQAGATHPEMYAAPTLSQVRQTAACDFTVRCTCVLTMWCLALLRASSPTDLPHQLSWH